MFAIVFTLYTGCRKGETLGLQWKDVDFDENKIHVGQQLNRHYDVDGDGEQRSVLEVTTPKTKQSVRDIYVCDSCYDECFTDCDDCGAPIRREDCYLAENGDSLCEHCYDARVDASEAEAENEEEAC